MAATPINLNSPVQYLKGVGPRRAELLKKLGMETVRDLLFYFPQRYEDRANIKTISQIVVDELATVRGVVKSAAATQMARSRKKVFEVAFADKTGVLRGTWFKFPEQAYVKRFAIGSEWIISGKVTLNRFRGSKVMVHPDTEELDADNGETGGANSLNLGRITPVYGLTEGFSQKALRQVMNAAMDYVEALEDFVPGELNVKYRIPPFVESVKFTHWPPNGVSVQDLSEFKTRHQKKLIFNEFFLMQAGLALKRGTVRKAVPECAMRVDVELLQKIYALLPFPLTGAQSRVLEEIAKDLAGDKPMNRLLQGDVGSGKTAVALACALMTARNRRQTAIMAPTEILASQHYRNMTRLLSDTKVKIELVTSGSEGKQRALERIASGESHIVVGTQALIQEGVAFHNLGLAVIDEQHRFGVRQRAELIKRGIHTHTLIMTATPIPRTLAMTLYGDLDVSVIDEMPPGRAGITTRIFDPSVRRAALELIRAEVKKGRQAYIIYPLVEESEKLELKAATAMFESLSEEDLAGLRLGLTHGRMKSAEKDEVMGRFARGEIDALVSTTVIEVGIDNPNATVMMIEHADRFGLSQLHQLRGRVGRGAHQSHCLLMAECHRGAPGWDRLKVMEKHLDGFKIAEEDLARRGAGDFFGVKQSGLPEFKIGDIVRDHAILAEARRAAFHIVEEDPHLSKPENRKLSGALKESWKDRFELGDIG
ncbi:MAG: ATP-dependent DNA helicase RecG [Nitrospinae bacterium]|nr:ATP-dependent DNA helicase RecG [Nitrospinota bacterium]